MIRGAAARGRWVWAGWAAFAAWLGVGSVGDAAAQLRLQELVVTVGASADWHRGNFSAVAVPRVDSAERVASGAGEARMQSGVVFLAGGGRRASLAFNGFLQQYATVGYRFRNYAPRLHEGHLRAEYQDDLGSGLLRVAATASTSGVNDRPPLPLYLSPGYRKYAGEATYQGSVRGTPAGLGASLESADYTAVLPQLDLLDHSVLRTWARATPWTWTRWSVDLFGQYSYFSYTRQGGSGTADDPFRTDHMFRAGATWRLADEERQLRGEVTVDGTVNRSNSRRVEYNLLRATLWASVPMGEDNTVFLEGRLAAKGYLRSFMHALVPGEEADNSTYVGTGLSRTLGPTLRGSVRVRWTRAETSIGDAYFRRLGVFVALHYRPSL